AGSWFRDIEVIRHDRFCSKQSTLLDVSVHPGTTAVGRPGIVIAQEQGKRLTIGIVNFKYANVRMVDGQIVSFLESETVEFSGGVKDSIQNNMIQLIVWFQL